MDAIVVGHRSNARRVTIAHSHGHEFEFEAPRDDEDQAARLYAVRWKNNRLPLDANRCRQLARVVAELQFGSSAGEAARSSYRA